MNQPRFFLLSFLYFFILLTSAVYGVGCDCGMDTTGVGDGVSGGGGDGGGTTGGDGGSGDGGSGDEGETGGDSGSGSISDLPEGVAISGTVNGEAIQVLDSEVEVSISNFNTGSGVIFSIGVSNESSSSSQKVLVSLSLSNASLINSFTVGTTYELNATELGVTSIGYINVTSSSGTSHYLIDSALLQFSEVNNQDGGTWSGIMQVNSSSSNTELTVDFSGAISFITV